ncbi:MAG: hypothetical protein FK730_04295 [Asgard group archaeon]|nr:hypothetical protein [Asgard group archaeon]
MPKKRRSSSKQKTIPAITLESKIHEEINKCPICDLKIRKKQVIDRCKKCNTLFHYEHLKQWLKNHSDCPVCQKEIPK